MTPGTGQKLVATRTDGCGQASDGNVAGRVSTAGINPGAASTRSERGRAIGGNAVTGSDGAIRRRPPERTGRTPTAAQAAVGVPVFPDYLVWPGTNTSLRDGCLRCRDVVVYHEHVGWSHFSRQECVVKIMALTVTLDPKGRLIVPLQVRKGMGLEPGDTFFLEYDEERQVLRYAKAENPFDVLAEHALREHRAGRTRGLRGFAAEHGIALDAE